MMYDFLVVGAGIFGSVFARQATDKGYKVLVIDKRNHIGGNAYTENIEGINVHKYGPHIFHTDDKEVWDYVNKFCEFNRFTNSPIANYNGEIYSLPFNMHTFNKLWGVNTPLEALEKIESQKFKGEPKNLEEQALSLVGKDIYEKLIKGYTEKQWGKQCKELPPEIIKRLPVRLTYDNNYFNSKYQGIPIGGYTKLFENLLDGIDVKLNTNYFDTEIQAKNIIYTGPIDEFFNYRYGALEYRSLRFETEILNTDNFQGNAVVNYTDRETPYTRICEHKWFENSQSEKTVISKEFSQEWKLGDEPYYPVVDKKNTMLYYKYKQLADNLPNIKFYGRLGEYKYYDMDKVIKIALHVL